MTDKRRTKYNSAKNNGSSNTQTYQQETDPPTQNKQQPKLLGDLNIFYWYQIFALDYVVVKAHNCKLAWRLQGISKVRKRAKNRNLYNQAPHLTQDTNRKVTISQLTITNESQEVSPFPVANHKASINRRARNHNTNKTEIA